MICNVLHKNWLKNMGDHDFLKMIWQVCEEHEDALFFSFLNLVIVGKMQSLDSSLSKC